MRHRPGIRSAENAEFYGGKMKTAGPGAICKGAGQWIVVALLAVTLGCGRDSKSAAATQVLAKVNGDEITVHQLNDRLSQVQIPTDVDATAVRKQVLESLIDEQLLVQRAMADKVDRDPQVLQAIERTKRQILAQAEIERLASKAEIQPDETAKFYASNPDLFEKRRVYTFRQFLLDTPKLDPSVKGQLDGAKTPADIASILKAAGIKFRDQTEVRAAEMLPMEALARMARMPRGDVILQSEGGRVLLMQLVDSAIEPVDLERAAPAIQAHLVANRNKDSAMNQLKELRRKAKLEYVGEMANAAAPPKLPVEALPLTKEDAPKSDDYIHKGISGLKK